MKSSALLRFASVLFSLLLFACGDSAVEDGSEPLPVPSGSSSGGGEGGDGGAGGGGSTTTSSGIGGAGACEGTGAVIAESGAANRLLLRGTVLAPTGPLVGEVLVEGDTITCVASSCASQPGANGATVIVTDGVISAGLIDSHNHALFNFLDEDDWAPTATFGDHRQWKADAHYAAALDAKQYFNIDQGAPGPPAPTVRYSCEIMKYAETRALISGTTSVQGSPGGVNRTCYRTVARSIDTTQNGLGYDKIQTASAMPTASTANGVCNNFQNGNTDSYVIHIAEGVNGQVTNEFTQLGTVTQNQSNGAGCLYNTKTTIVHGTDMTEAQFDIMAQNQMALSWSPKSNVFLYGLGTDLSKTTNIPLVLSKGIMVALSPDWTLGGSQNLLDEMRFADRVDNEEFGNILTPRDLHDMVTFNAARALGLENVLGSLVVGQKADIAIYLSQGLPPYEAVLAATPRETVLVMVGGRVLYADAALESLAPAENICEPFEACCRPKVLCIAETGHAAGDQLDETFAEFTAKLEAAMVAYDALNFSQWKFAPIAPVLKCNVAP